MYFLYMYMYIYIYIYILVYPISNFTKISPVGAASFHAYERIDRQTYKHDCNNSRFCQFCERAIWNKTFNKKCNYVFCENIKSNRNLCVVQH